MTSSAPLKRDGPVRACLSGLIFYTRNLQMLAYLLAQSNIVLAPRCTVAAVHSKNTLRQSLKRMLIELRGEFLEILVTRKAFIT